MFYEWVYWQCEAMNLLYPFVACHATRNRMCGYYKTKDEIDWCNYIMYTTKEIEE